MDISAELRRVHRRLPAFLGPQAVIEEIGQAALRLPVHLRGRQRQAVAVEPADIGGADGPQLEVRPAAHLLIILQYAQLPGAFLPLPGGQERPGLQRIRIGKAKGIRHKFLRPGKLRQAAVDKRGLLTGGIHRRRLPCPAEHAVDLCEFCLDALHGPAGEGYAQPAQGDPLLVRQHPRRAGIGGQISLLGAQQDQVCRAVAAHGGNGPQLHHIQHRRDGSHIVLAQQQPQQTDKVLRLPMGLAQHIIHLLQSGQEDLPQLVQYLRIPAVALLVQRSGQLIQALLHVYGLQEIVQRLYLLPQAGRPAEAPAQTLQGCGQLLPVRIQRLQALPGVNRPFRPQAVRVVLPGLEPTAPPDVPEECVVFDQIAGIRIHAGQGRAEVAEHTALVIVAQGRVQGGKHRGDHALLQDILGAGLVDGDVHSGKHQIHQRLVLGHVGAHQGDIPVTAAAAHQGADPVCRPHHLGPGGIRPVNMQVLPRRASGDRPLKQPLAHDLHFILPGRDRLHLYRHMEPLGGPVKLRGRLPRFFKGQLVGSDAVAVQADGDAGAELDQVLQNRHVLPGKVREAVDVKYMLPGVVTVLQLLQQPGHLVPGVPLAPAAQAVVALHQQGKLLQLLGKAALGLGGGFFQVLGADAAALEFIHRADQLRQEFRLGLHGGIGLQPAGQLPRRRRHGHHPAAVIQAFHCAAARLLRRPAGQAGKGQHLRIAAGRIPRRRAEGPLRLVADQLRHHENAVRPPPGHVPGQPRQYLMTVGRPVRSDQKMQHHAASFPYGVKYIINRASLTDAFPVLPQKIRPSGRIFSYQMGFAIKTLG